MAKIELKKNLSKKHLIIFDGACPFCSKQIHFIQKFNKDKKFLFIPRSSEAGQTIRQLADLNDLESLLLVTGKEIFTESDAVIHLFSLLPFPYSLLSFAKILPQILRDYAYRLIAKYRKKIPIKHCPFDKDIKENTLEKFIN